MDLPPHDASMSTLLASYQSMFARWILGPCDRKVKNADGETVSLLSVAGFAIILVGLVLVCMGAILAWREESRNRTNTKGFSESVDALGRLAEALASHPIGVRLVFLGIVLVVLGSLVSGVAGIAN